MGEGPEREQCSSPAWLYPTFQELSCETGSFSHRGNHCRGPQSALSLSFPFSQPRPHGPLPCHRFSPTTGLTGLVGLVDCFFNSIVWCSAWWVPLNSQGPPLGSQLEATGLWTHKTQAAWPGSLYETFSYLSCFSLRCRSLRKHSGNGKFPTIIVSNNSSSSETPIGLSHHFTPLSYFMSSTCCHAINVQFSAPVSTSFILSSTTSHLLFDPATNLVSLWVYSVLSKNLPCYFSDFCCMIIFVILLLIFNSLCIIILYGV